MLLEFYYLTIIMTKYENEIYLANRYDCFFYWGQNEYYLKKHKQARKKYNKDVKNGLCKDFNF